MVRNTRVFAFDNFFVKSLHILSSERRHERAEFIQKTPHRPNVALAVVRLILPHFWWRIVGRSRLRVRQFIFLFDYFRHVKIPELGWHVSEQKDVGALHVSVQDLPHMKSPKPSHDLYKNVPNFLLFNICFSLLIATNLLVQIPIVRKLHDQA